MGGLEALGIDQELQGVIVIDKVRAVADQHAELAYMANPDAAELAKSHAIYFAAGTYDSYGLDYNDDPEAHDPTASTLLSAYTKLAFVFRDPQNPDSTLADETIGDLICILLDAMAKTSGQTAGLAELSLSLDIYAAHVFLIREKLAGTEVDALSPDDQLWAAHDRYLALIEDMIHRTRIT